MLALGGTFACSSSGDDDGAGNQLAAEQPGSASAEISAADGGEVKLGAAALAIPGGALDADTTVTVASTKPSSDLPEASSVQGLVYDFGPTGTTFNTPVALTLPLPSAPGSGKEAVISYLDEATNSWSDLTTSVAGGSVSAEIEHFSKYVVRVRVVNVDTSGGDVDCSFTACGGDPSGVWHVADACLNVDGGDGPFGDKCPDGTVDADITASGTLTIADGRYTWDLTLSGNALLEVPADCVGPLSGNAATSCSDFDDSDAGLTCTGSITTSCSCNKPLDPKTENSSGTLEVKGSQAIGTPDDDPTSANASDFCVQGNTLKIMQHDVNDDGSTQDTLLVFTR
jgi:hypothetical protein